MNNNKSEEVIQFFSNYYKFINDNYMEETNYWKISYEIKFIADLFNSINFCVVGFQPLHQFLPESYGYRYFKEYFANSFNSYKYEIGRCISSIDIYYEIFKLIKSLIFNKQLKIAETDFNTIILWYDENKEKYPDFQSNYINKIKCSIMIQSLNNLIFSILSLYDNNYDEFIKNKQYNIQLHYDINRNNLQNFIDCNGRNSILYVQTFDNYDTNRLSLYFIWTFYDIPYDYYCRLYDVLNCHLAILNDYIKLSQLPKIADKIINVDSSKIDTKNESIPPKIKPDKKKVIPKKIKQLVWNTNIGEDKGTGLCLCCKTTQISQMSFHCGHIISEFNGGGVTVDNLLPVCSLCNNSMGTRNMNEFIETHGLGKNKKKIKDKIIKSKKPMINNIFV